MVWGAILGIGASLIGARSQRRAATAAANSQSAAAAEATERVQAWRAAGESALAQQRRMLGLEGATEQQASIAGIEQSPIFEALTRQGEEAMLQNAAATGGLRGGNIQAALAQFRPQMLQDRIQEQLAGLAGLSDMGLRAGGAQGGPLMQAGAAQAGGILGRAEANAQMWGGIGRGVGQIIGGWNMPGGGASWFGRRAAPHIGFSGQGLRAPTSGFGLLGW